jgi:hypothetical protein
MIAGVHGFGQRLSAEIIDVLVHDHNKMAVLTAKK